MKGATSHSKTDENDYKKIGRSASAVLIMSLLLMGCTTLVDRHFRATVADPRDTLTLRGLKDPVTISRDAHGIPYVKAKKAEDMAMALGYVHASDRLAQMTGLKLAAYGRLAEMAGKAVLDLDIYMRTMNLRRRGEMALTKLSPETRKILERYAAGVNAYQERHKDKLPPGLALAGYTPEPWQPIDSIMVYNLIAFSMSFNLQEEIAALNVAQAVGTEKAAWLLPVYPDEPIPFAEAAKLKDIDLKKAAASVLPLTDIHPVLKALGLSGLAASNNWAIGKDRTRGGKSIFANDAHLFLSMPSLMNMIHIKYDQHDAAGACVAGVPVVVAGYNGHIAWGATMVMADNQDIFLERLRLDDGKLQYFYKDQWRPINERQEIIKVKHGAPVPVTVRETIHGPLLNDVLKKKPIHPLQPKQIDIPYGIAVSWAGAAEEDRSFEAFFNLSAARSVDEASPIMKRIQVIPLNMVFADRDSIAWQVTGTYPQRSKGRGLMPSPGWTGEYDWTGLLAPEVLPNTKNPSEGFIGTANNRTVPVDYPYILSSSWWWPERAERIAQMASATNVHTVRSSMDMQLDTRSLFVPKLKSAILAGALAEEITNEINAWTDGEKQGKARLALAILRDFDGDMKADAHGAALVGSWLHTATRNIFSDELGPDDAGVWKSFLAMSNKSYNATCDHLLVRGDESPFWDDVRTPVKETKAMIIARSMADAVDLLESRLGKDKGMWAWGNLHTYLWETDTSKMAPAMGFKERFALNRLWSYFNRGPYPAPGDMLTLNVSAYTMGSDFDTWLIPAVRIIVDFSLDEPMVGVNNSGQSDNPSSPHYDDGIRTWREGRYIPFPFREEAVRAQYSDILTLLPDMTIAGAEVEKVAEGTVEIKKNIDAVFSYVINMENFGKWFPEVVGIKAENNLGHGQTGKRYLELVKDPLKGEVKIPIEVKESQKNRLFITQGNYPPLLPQMTVQFSEGTHDTIWVHWRMDSRNESISFRWFVLPLAKMIMGPRAQKGLNNLKNNLEKN